MYNNQKTNEIINDLMNKLFVYWKTNSVPHKEFIYLTYTGSNTVKIKNLKDKITTILKKSFYDEIISKSSEENIKIIDSMVQKFCLKYIEKLIVEGYSERNADTEGFLVERYIRSKLKEFINYIINHNTIPLSITVAKDDTNLNENISYGWIEGTLYHFSFIVEAFAKLIAENIGYQTDYEITCHIDKYKELIIDNKGLGTIILDDKGNIQNEWDKLTYEEFEDYVWNSNDISIIFNDDKFTN